MINKIYEKISDKTLKLGCKIKIDDGDIYSFLYENIYKFDNGETRNLGLALINEGGPYALEYGREYQIIGNPIYIGDILYYLENRYVRTPEIAKSHFFKTLFLWYDKTKPIEMQGEDCITYIYNFIN